MAPESSSNPAQLCLAAAVFCGMCCGLFGCDAKPPARLPGTPIVLLSLDTLRADHLSSYGYERATSPNLDAFASESVRFSRAHAQASGTLPSHLSLLSSLNPPQFRITRDDGRNIDQGSTRLTLPDAVITLAEALRDRGYETAAFTDGGATSPRYGFAQGFSHYEINAARGLQSSLTAMSGYLFDRSVRLAEVEPARWPPLFLFIHTYDIHAPYDAPDPFAQRFSQSTFQQLRQSLNVDEVLSAPSVRAAGGDSEIAAELRALYDNGIAWTDHSVAKLFARLRDHNLYDDAVIVVVSDHGEEFYDHGGLNHGAQVYEEHVHVPLMIRYPNARNAGLVVDEPVALIDVAPTVTQLAGLPVTPSFAGASLVDPIENRETAGLNFRPIYFETPSRPGGSHGILKGRWKLIRGESTGSLELFDLDSDPRETHNLAESRPDKRDELLEELVDGLARMEASGRQNGWFAVPNRDAPELSTEQRETLRALGYIGEEVE